MTRTLKKAKKQSVIRFAFIGALWGLAAMVIISVVAAALSMKSQDPARLALVFSILTNVGGTAVAAISSGMLYRQKAFICAVSSGGFLVAIFLLLSLMTKSDVEGILYRVLPIVVSAITAFLCGIIIEKRLSSQSKNKYLKRIRK